MVSPGLLVDTGEEGADHEELARRRWPCDFAGVLDAGHRNLMDAAIFGGAVGLGDSGDLGMPAPVTMRVVADGAGAEATLMASAPASMRASVAS